MESTIGRTRVLLVKSSLDGHWRGVVTVATGLRDAGMEVIYGGMLTPTQIAQAAIEEDVDVIGINVGGRIGPVRDLLRILDEEKYRPLVIVGGNIPREDIVDLKAFGIEGVFPPGSTIDSIVEFIHTRLSERSATAPV